MIDLSGIAAEMAGKKAEKKTNLKMVALAVLNSDKMSEAREADDKDAFVKAAQELMTEKLETVKSKKAFVTFGAVAKSMGIKGYKPSDTPRVLWFVESCGAEFQALIVDRNGCHGSKVAAQHKKTLEGWGYTEFPEIAVSKKSKEI